MIQLIIHHPTAAITVDLNETTQAAGTGDKPGDRISGVENIVGSDYQDTITGDNLANDIAGAVWEMIRWIAPLAMMSLMVAQAMTPFVVMLTMIRFMVKIIMTRCRVMRVKTRSMVAPAMTLWMAVQKMMNSVAMATIPLAGGAGNDTLFGDVDIDVSTSSLSADTMMVVVEQTH